LFKKCSNRIKENISDFKAIIISDYGKGLFQVNDLSQTIIAMAKEQRIPVFVDPKGRNWERYRGATCITPNTKELELVNDTDIADDNKLLVAMKNTIQKFELPWLLVTRGSLGMCLMNRDGEVTHINRSGQTSL
jgi:bifunctional ADP-heptose synthase (sugar kinase/adenylyltransferase)